MGHAPQLSSDDDDDEEEWEDAAPAPNEVNANANVGHPYRAPAVRDADRPRVKKRPSKLTAIVATTGGLAAVGVMYALTRVPMHRPPEPVVEVAPVVVPPIPTEASQVIHTAPASQAMVAHQAEEMEIAMAYERKDDARLVSMLLPQMSTTSCARLRILEISCSRLHRWGCSRAARAEFNHDGCQSQKLPYR